MPPKRFTAHVSYNYNPARRDVFDLSFGQAVRKDVRERLQAECGGEWSETYVVLHSLPEGQQKRAEAIVKKAYPHASIHVTDDRPEKHSPECRITWSQPSRDWYASRVGWLGHVMAFKSVQTTKRDDPNKYKVYTLLPGFGGDHEVIAEGPTKKDAELAAEVILPKFVRKLRGSLNGL